MDYAKLKVELTVDPLARGYAGMSDTQAADSLNALNRTVNVASVTGQDIFEAVVPGEYAALTADQKSLLHALIGMGTIKVNATNTKAALLAMFGAGTTTRANLVALQKTPCSRATELDLGREANHGDIYWVRTHMGI